MVATVATMIWGGKSVGGEKGFIAAANGGDRCHP